MFELSYAHRAGLMAALPLSLMTSVDKALCDEIAGALVALEDMSQEDAVLHAFEAQRILITPAIAESIVAQMGVTAGEIDVARLKARLAAEAARDAALGLAA